MEIIDVEIKELVATSTDVHERAVRELQASELVLLGGGMAEVSLM